MNNSFEQLGVVQKEREKFLSFKKQQINEIKHIVDYEIHHEMLRKRGLSKPEDKKQKGKLQTEEQETQSNEKSTQKHKLKKNYAEILIKMETTMYNNQKELERKLALKEQKRQEQMKKRLEIRMDEQKLKQEEQKQRLEDRLKRKEEELMKKTMSYLRRQQEREAKKEAKRKLETEEATLNHNTFARKELNAKTETNFNKKPLSSSKRRNVSSTQLLKQQEREKAKALHEQLKLQEMKQKKLEQEIKEMKIKEIRIKNEELLKQRREQLTKKYEINAINVEKQIKLNQDIRNTKLIEQKLKQEEINENIARIEKQKEYEKNQKIKQMKEREQRLQKIKEEKSQIAKAKRKLQDELTHKKQDALIKLKQVFIKGNYTDQNDIYQQVFEEDDLKELEIEPKKKDNLSEEKQKTNEDTVQTDDLFVTGIKDSSVERKDSEKNATNKEEDNDFRDFENVDKKNESFADENEKKHSSHEHQEYESFKEDRKVPSEKEDSNDYKKKEDNDNNNKDQSVNSIRDKSEANSEQNEDHKDKSEKKEDNVIIPPENKQDGFHELLDNEQTQEQPHVGDDVHMKTKTSEENNLK